MDSRRPPLLNEAAPGGRLAFLRNPTGAAAAKERQRALEEMKRNTDKVDPVDGADHVLEHLDDER